MMKNKSVGNIGENLATEYLRNKGYDILANNFRTRFGELDIIASKNKTIIFFEVKTRNSLIKGMPYEAVNLRKLSHLKRAIHYYLLTNNYKDYKLRLDVVTVLLGEDNKASKIKHYENVELKVN